MMALFDRVKRSIKASPRMSRTERFLKYAEEHPSEVLAAIDDKTDALIRELEQKEREAARAPAPRACTPAALHPRAARRGRPERIKNVAGTSRETDEVGENEGGSVLAFRGARAPIALRFQQW